MDAAMFLIVDARVTARDASEPKSSAGSKPSTKARIPAANSLSLSHMPPGYGRGETTTQAKPLVAHDDSVTFHATPKARLAGISVRRSLRVCPGYRRVNAQRPRRGADPEIRA